MSDLQVTAGIDIGGTNTTVGIVGPDGRILGLTTFPTSTPGGPDHFVARIAMTVDEERQQVAPEYTLAGIGIASPAANLREGTIYRPANLAWGTFNVVGMLKEHFDVPVAIVNDSNASALGELHFGLGKTMKNFIVLTLGTGLGAGIIVEGRLLEGETGVAGELGHVTLDPAGRECGCGRRGCAETYVSATGLRRTALELATRRTAHTDLHTISFDSLTSKRVFELAQAGDPVAREAFEITGRHLGRLIADVTAVFDPQAVIIAGGLAHAGDLLLVPARAFFESNVLELHRGRVPILRSALPDGQAAVLGASTVVRSAAVQNIMQ